MDTLIENQSHMHRSIGEEGSAPRCFHETGNGKVLWMTIKQNVSFLHMHGHAERPKGSRMEVRDASFPGLRQRRGFEGGQATVK